MFSSTSFCYKTRIILFISISFLLAFTITFLLKIFDLLNPIIDKFKTFWNNDIGVLSVTMVTCVLLFTLIFLLFFGCYYKCTVNQDKLLKSNQETQILLTYAPGIKNYQINQLQEELSKKYYQQTKTPNDKTLLQEIKTIEDQIDTLKTTSNNSSITF